MMLSTSMSVVIARGPQPTRRPHKTRLKRTWAPERICTSPAMLARAARTSAPIRRQAPRRGLSNAQLQANVGKLSHVWSARTSDIIVDRVR